MIDILAVWLHHGGTLVLYTVLLVTVLVPGTVTLPGTGTHIHICIDVDIPVAACVPVDYNVSKITINHYEEQLYTPG
jgi:hypothetical protein